MLTNVIILWLLVGAMSNIYFVKKTMVEMGRIASMLHPDDKVGLVSGIVLALFLPPVFWAIILAMNLIKRRGFSFSLA